MDQSLPILEPPAAAPPPPAMSLPARLLNVFAAPGDVFTEVKASAPCSANWVVPALILVLVSWIGAALIFSQDSVNRQLSDITDRALQQRAQSTPITEQQAEQARKVAGIVAKVGAFAAPPFAAFVAPFWGGLIIWLVGAKIIKGSFTYMKAVEVAGLANMIGVLDGIVRTLLIVSLGNLYATPSLGLAVKDFDPQNTLHGLLAAVNVITFWLLAVRAIGLSRLSGVSFGKAAAWIFGIWVAFLGVGLGFGFAMRVLGRAATGG